MAKVKDSSNVMHQQDEVPMLQSSRTCSHGDELTTTSTCHGGCQQPQQQNNEDEINFNSCDDATIATRGREDVAEKRSKRRQPRNSTTRRLIAMTTACLCTLSGVSSFCPQQQMASLTGSTSNTRSTSNSRLYARKSKRQPPPKPGAGDELVKTKSTTGEGGGGNFWYTANANTKDDDAGKVPVVPSLDAIGGPLPPGCYHTLGQDQYQPKPTCRLTMAINLDTASRNALGDDFIMDPAQIVQGMHQAIDSGMTSFCLGLPSSNSNTNINTKAAPKAKRGDDYEDDGRYLQEQLFSSGSLQTWGEEHVYGRLLQQTPKSVMKQVQLVVPFPTPSGSTHASHVSRHGIRESITESLTRMGTDAMDTLQLEYCEGSPYHLEVMDHLVDLQREGLIRSIAGRNFPASTLRSLYGCGFSLDSQQLDNVNLLQNSHQNDYQNAWNAEQRLAATDLELPHMFSNPLAGGLLSNRFETARFPPLSSEVGDAARNQYTRSVWLWALARKSGKDVPRDAHKLFWSWTQYQNDVVPVLHSIARKYEVDMAAVSLRWIFQMDDHWRKQKQSLSMQSSTQVQSNTNGIIVGCNIMMQDPDLQQDSMKRRLKSLRSTFRFELDEDDMERLNAIGGVDKTDLELEEEAMNLEAMMGNKKLWL